jgi:hypothetical protein
VGVLADPAQWPGVAALDLLADAVCHLLGPALREQSNPDDAVVR